MSNLTIDQRLNHKEAWDLAHVRRENSNLARCYIDLHMKARALIEEYERERGWARDTTVETLALAVKPVTEAP